MAYAATEFDEFRLAYDRSNLDKHDNRFSVYGAYSTFVKDTPNLIPGYADFIAGRVSEARTVSIPILSRETLSTGSTRTCTATANQGTSAYVTPSWTTIETGFMMVPAEHEDNYIGYTPAFQHQLDAVQKAFLLAMDTAAAAYLVSYKTTSGGYAAAGNPFTITGGYMQVPLAYHDTFFDELSGIMLSNDITEQEINIIGSPRVKPLVDYYSNQGTGNDVNLGFQYGGFSFAYSNRVAVSTALLGTAFACPRGSLAFLNFVDIDARMGHKSGDGKEWYQEALPALGKTVGVLYQSTCADKSGLLAGLQATLVEAYMFSYDYAFTSSYDASASSDMGVILGIDFIKT